MPLLLTRRSRSMSLSASLTRGSVVEADDIELKESEPGASEGGGASDEAWAKVLAGEKPGPMTEFKSSAGTEAFAELVVRAIRAYGRKIAAKARKGAEAQGLPLTPENYDAGGPNWPSLGACDRVERVVVEADTVHPGETRTRIYGCGLAKAAQAQGQEALGRLYCLIDVAKMMAYNPDYKVIHLLAELDGDPYCELATRRTTAQEREDFAAGGDWSYIDQG